MPTLIFKQLPITQYWQNATDSLCLEFKFVLVALRQYSTVITNRGGLLRINFIVQKIKIKKPTHNDLIMICVYNKFITNFQSPSSYN